VTPSEQPVADGVVAVAGGGGVVLFGLLEGDEEQVGLAGLVPVDAGLERKGRGHDRGPEPGEHFLAGVGGVDLQRHGLQEAKWGVEVGDLIPEQGNQLQ
jgi:hypothetical protein